MDRQKKAEKAKKNKNKFDKVRALLYRACPKPGVFSGSRSPKSPEHGGCGQRPGRFGAERGF